MELTNTELLTRGRARRKKENGRRRRARTITTITITTTTHAPPQLIRLQPSPGLAKEVS